MACQAEACGHCDEARLRCASTRQPLPVRERRAKAGGKCW
jgi:hypothetical protein